jgi:hypothetical protein
MECRGCGISLLSYQWRNRVAARAAVTTTNPGLYDLRPQPRRYAFGVRSLQILVVHKNDGFFPAQARACACRTGPQ